MLPEAPWESVRRVESRGGLRCFGGDLELKTNEQASILCGYCNLQPKKLSILLL